MIIHLALVLKSISQHPETPKHRVRRQTGITNRWRLPQSLYSDLLGSSQALKAINMPFNQTLVKSLTSTYPACNENLKTILAFDKKGQDDDEDENMWSWFKKAKETE